MIQLSQSIASVVYLNGVLRFAFPSFPFHFKIVIQSNMNGGTDGVDGGKVNNEIKDAVDKAFKNSRIQSLYRGILEIGNQLDIDIRECRSDGVEGSARAFLSKDPSAITLCSNRLRKQDVEEVLTHEMIHGFDYLVRKMDLTECEKLAWSEIRAAREAECSSCLFEFTMKACVRSTASQATKNIFPKRGGTCVDAVFDSAYKDLSPVVTKSSSGGIPPPLSPLATPGSFNDNNDSCESMAGGGVV